MDRVVTTIPGDGRYLWSMAPVFLIESIYHKVGRTSHTFQLEN